MRSGVWSWLAGLLAATTLSAAGCSGGYPLPPTRCDDFCDATHGSTLCAAYDPAGCVAQCELAGIDLPACSSELDAVIACFHRYPAERDLECSFSPELPTACNIPEQLLALCLSDHLNVTEQRD